MSSGDYPLCVGVLGVPTVHVSGHAISLSPVERNIVALLVAAGPNGISSDSLADGLWPDELPDSWTASLRNSISKLNKKTRIEEKGIDGLVSMRSPVRRLVVPEAAVDAWQLLAAATADSLDDADIDPKLFTGTPFDSCELTGYLRSGVDRLESARHDLIARLSAEGRRVSNQLLASIRALHSYNPHEHGLTHLAVKLHLKSGQYELAVQILNESLADFGADDRMPPTLAKTKALLDEAADEPASVPVTTTPTRSPTVAALAQEPIAGRQDQLNALLSEALSGAKDGVLLHGPPGVGKTRLAVELATRLHAAGFHSAYLAADRDSFSSLQPFIESFRELRTRTAPFIGQLDDQEGRYRCWAAVIEFFEAAFAGHPICLIVDDAQWFDAQSKSLLISLCRAELGNRLFVIAVGRDRDPDAAWAHWLGDLGRLNMSAEMVRSLDASGMIELLQLADVDINPVQAARLAEQLVHLSSGIPRVAQWLIKEVNPSTLEISTAAIEGTGFAAITNALEPQVQNFGAIASILGMRFRLADVAHLSGQDLDATRALAEQMVQADLLIELSMPDEYRFPHALISEALTQSLSPAQRRRFHTKAFALLDQTRPSGTIHRMALHAAASVPEVAPAVAANALLASAALSMQEGDPAAAVSRFREAETIHAASISLEDSVSNVTALELSGTRATAQRRRIVQAALDAGEFQLALEAALSGLPEAEVFEGDRDRVTVLESLPADKLDPKDRHRWRVALSRQQTLVGDIKNALRVADEIYEHARSVDEQAEGWLHQRLAEGSGAGHHPRLETWMQQVEDPDLRVRLDQARIQHVIATGKAVTNHQLLLDHRTRTVRDHKVQYQWFAQLFLSIAATARGDHKEAESIAKEAHTVGLRNGIRIAEGTWHVQNFGWFCLQGLHGALAELLKPSGPPEVTANPIYDALTASVQFGHGVDTDDQRERKEAILRVGFMTDDLSTYVVSAMPATLVDVLVGSGQDDLIDWAKRRLDPHRGTYLAVAAALDLGPCDAILARLERDPEMRRALHRQAIAQVDDDKLPLWQVCTRVDLAADLHQRNPGEANELLATARRYAATPWLAGLVDTRFNHAKAVVALRS